MLKMEIRFDETRIMADHKYEPQVIYRAVDKAFGKYDFRKQILPDGTICYYGNGHPRDYGRFGRLITTLKDKRWFMPYLDKWLWYNSDDGMDETDFVVEDILHHYYGSNAPLKSVGEDRMTDLTFTSVLATEEAEKNFEDVDIFSEIMQGLQEAIEHCRRVHNDEEKKNADS